MRVNLAVGTQVDKNIIMQALLVGSLHFLEEVVISISSPLRSVLFVPGNKPRAIEKARTLDADIIVFDLEDSVAPEQKQDARATVVSAINQGGFSCPLVVRVNGLESPWAKADMAAVAKANATSDTNNLLAVLLPKIECRQNVTDAEQLMFLERLPASVSLWAMVETPRAISNLADIAKTGNKLSALLFGTNDLSSELQLPAGSPRSSLGSSIEQLVTAARANGLAVIDGVYNNFKDDAGLKAECAEGVALGFDGKSLIHPSQINDANMAFMPSEADIVRAKSLIAAFEAGVDKGLGVIQFEGEMVEALHVDAAKRVLAKLIKN